MKRFFQALRAKFYFERHVIFTISLREIVKMTCRSEEYWGCVKSFLPPAAAKHYFETDVFLMILLRKIIKNTSVSNFNLARSAVKRLFTQPLNKE